MPHNTLPKTIAEMKKSDRVILSATEFDRRIRGKCFLGLYRHPFQFVMRVNDDQTLWGRNNFGTQDNGHWSIDEKTGSMSVSWQGGWDAHTTHGYSVGKAIHLFDIHTQEWRTTFLHEIDEKELNAPKFLPMLIDKTNQVTSIVEIIREK